MGAIGALGAGTITDSAAAGGAAGSAIGFAVLISRGGGRAGAVGFAGSGALP
jgi:hypothetical protein